LSNTSTTDLAEHVIATLRAHEVELRAAGIRTDWSTGGFFA